MQTNIQKKVGLIVLSFLTILTFTLTSCQKEQQLAQPAKTDLALYSNLLSSDLSSVIANARENAQTVDYVYLVGEEPLEGPDKTVAPNGDTITIAGSGTFSIHAKSVTGSGWFKHTNANGALLASGTWEALELLSFKSFGAPGDPFPASFEAGLANIRIHLSPDAGGDGFDAILKIYCVLAGLAPPGFEEGVGVVIQDVINFNDPVHGQTLFIRQ